MNHEFDTLKLMNIAEAMQEVIDKLEAMDRFNTKHENMVLMSQALFEISNAVDQMTGTRTEQQLLEIFKNSIY